MQPMAYLSAVDWATAPHKTEELTADETPVQNIWLQSATSLQILVKYRIGVYQTPKSKAQIAAQERNKS